MTSALSLATATLALVAAGHWRLTVANRDRRLPIFGRPEAPAVTPPSARWLQWLSIPAGSTTVVRVAHLPGREEAVIILSYLALLVLLPVAVIGSHNRRVRRRAPGAGHPDPWP